MTFLWAKPIKNMTVSAIRELKKKKIESQRETARKNFLASHLHFHSNERCDEEMRGRTGQENILIHPVGEKGSAEGFS